MSPGVVHWSFTSFCGRRDIRNMEILGEIHLKNHLISRKTCFSRREICFSLVLGWNSITLASSLALLSESYTALASTLLVPESESIIVSLYMRLASIRLDPSRNVYSLGSLHDVSVTCTVSGKEYRLKASLGGVEVVARKAGRKVGMGDLHMGICLSLLV